MGGRRRDMSKRSFGQIMRLPSKRYRARYTGPDTALHNAPSTFDTRMDAEAWLTDERRLISAGTWTSPAARAAGRLAERATRDALAFDVYARTWLNRQHHVRPTTLASYRTAIERHLSPAFGNRRIDELRPVDVETWYASFGDRTPTARAHAYQVLRKMMLDAEDAETIRRNPARIKRGGLAPASTVRDPEVLTMTELLELVHRMPEKHRALTLLCGLGGLRFGEAVALRRADIDLTAGTVRVVHGVTRVGGKKIVGPPKTPNAKRTVTLPTIVVDALRAHMAGSIAGGRLGYVFQGRDGQPLSPTALYGRAERIEKRDGRKYHKAGYGFYAAREAIGRPTLHWHDLRRTAATLGAQSGATVREMQDRLGHSTAAMALHYQASGAERDRLIAERLQATIDAAQGSR